MGSFEYSNQSIFVATVVVSGTIKKNSMCACQHDQLLVWKVISEGLGIGN